MAFQYCAEVAKQLYALGLDCFVGFYRKTHASHLALVYDVVEPFRHFVDRSVFEIQDKIKKERLCFLNTRNSCSFRRINEKILHLISAIFDRKRKYEARTGVRRAHGFQRMKEITIMKMKCIELKDFVMSPNIATSSLIANPTAHTR